MNFLNTSVIMAPKQIHPVGKANQMSAPREDNTPGDMLLGAIISCKPDRLRRRCSIVSAVSFDDPPLGMHGDIFDEKEFIFLKLKAAELETEYEVQRSRANKSELLLTTMREQNAALERENARLKQEIQAANNLTKKLQKKLLGLHRITRQKNVCSPPSQPNLSRSAASNSDESARSSLIDLLRQSFMPKEDLVNIEHEICTTEHEKKSEKRRLSCPSITDKVSKGGRRRFSFSNLSFSDVNFDPAEVDSIDHSSTDDSLAQTGETIMHRISSSFSNMSFKSENLFDFSKDEEDGTISECMLNRKPRKKERIFPASSTVAGKRQFSSSISNKSFKSEYFSDLSEHDEDFKEDLSGVEILRVSGISSGLGHSDDEEDDFRLRQR